MIDRNIINSQQVNLIVTGTNWTTARAIGIMYQLLSGVWRLKYNMAGTLSVAAAKPLPTILGIVFKNAYGTGGTHTQSASLEGTEGGIGTRTGLVCRHDVNAATINLSFSAAVNQIGISGDVEL